MFIKVKINGKDNYFLKENIKQINETDNGFELLVLRNGVNSKGELSFGVLTFETNQIPVVLAGELIGFVDSENFIENFIQTYLQYKREFSLLNNITKS